MANGDGDTRAAEASADGRVQPIEHLVSTLLADAHAAQGAIWLVDRREGDVVPALLAAAHATAASAVTIVADWRPGFDRPFGALLDVIEEAATYLREHRPEMLGRFQWTLSNLLFPWWRAANLSRVGELRAGLAELSLRGDTRFIHEFFQKRNVRPQVLAYIVHLIVGAAHEMAERAGGPVILVLDTAELADSLTLSAVRLLRCGAQQRRVPLKICLVGASGASGAFGQMARRPSERGWTIARAHAAPPSVPRHFTPPELEMLWPASAHALPFRSDTWLEAVNPALRPQAAALLETLLVEGVLARVGSERFRFLHGRLRDAVHATCPPELSRLLHRQLLKSEEAADPFAAAWHARESESSTRSVDNLAAMERAWAVSAYECALTFARAAFAAPSEQDAIDSHLVLAMLSYEAGEYEAADRLLDAAIDAPHPIVDRGLLHYLKGYNAVFGTGDYQKGIRLLAAVLDACEQKGDARTAAYVKNTMAYAHFRSRHIDDAVQTEERNIQDLNAELIGDSFLQSILQLNLGRLYNHIGDSERAISTVEAGLHAKRKELSSHTLLLCYATLASVQSAAGRHDEALRNYRHMFELVRNMQLDSVKDQVVFALSKMAPPVPADRLTRTDEILFYLHFHLARTFEAVGLAPWARTLRESLLATTQVVPEMERALLPAADARQAAAREAPPRTARLTADAVVESWNGVVRSAPSGARPAELLAETLVLGGSVAILAEHFAGGRVPLLQSVVLYDPRLEETADRMSNELGGSHIRKATAAFVLPEGVDLFDPLEPRCGAQQMTTATHDLCARAPGLAVGVNVQVVSNEFDGLVCDVVKVFGDRTGLPLVAAAPFHLWRGDLVTTPQQAVLDFLVTSIDRLYLAGRVIEKVHGPGAVQNIAMFRPRLSEEALVYDSGGSCLIRIKRRGGYAGDQVLKVHPDVRKVIDLCDGSRDLSALLMHLGRPADPTSREGEKLASLLRGLWRHGALCFDPPAAERAAVDAIPA